MKRRYRFLIHPFIFFPICVLYGFAKPNICTMHGLELPYVCTTHGFESPCICTTHGFESPCKFFLLYIEFPYTLKCARICISVQDANHVFHFACQPSLISLLPSIQLDFPPNCNPHTPFDLHALNPFALHVYLVGKKINEGGKQKWKKLKMKM